MSLKKVWIEDGCIACGQCEATCPEVFKVYDTSTVIEGVNYSDYEALIKEAAENCPAGVIKFSE